MEIIIVPDVHGRKFWKKGAEYIKTHPNSKIIFLGDYLDPYTRHEDITQDQAYDNFIELIEFAKEYQNQVVLLWGNHDLFYINYKHECCRHNYLAYGNISAIFRENIYLFRFAYKEDNYLFTHAGVTKDWLLQNQLEIDENNIVDYLNSNPDTIWQIGYSRGGDYLWGSPIWACWHYDWPLSSNPFHLTQIFGHTRMETNKYQSMKNQNIYMLDCRECFYLDDSGLKLLNDVYKE